MTSLKADSTGDLILEQQPALLEGGELGEGLIEMAGFFADADQLDGEIVIDAPFLTDGFREGHASGDLFLDADQRGADARRLLRGEGLHSFQQGNAAGEERGEFQNQLGPLGRGDFVASVTPTN